VLRDAHLSKHYHRKCTIRNRKRKKVVLRAALLGWVNFYSVSGISGLRWFTKASLLKSRISLC
jgi:hypothetical protein